MWVTDLAAAAVLLLTGFNGRMQRNDTLTA